MLCDILLCIFIGVILFILLCCITFTFVFNTKLRADWLLLPHFHLTNMCKNYCSEYKVSCSVRMLEIVLYCITTPLKAKNYAISSDTHQLQLIKLHHFKQDRF